MAKDSRLRNYYLEVHSLSSAQVFFSIPLKTFSKFSGWTWWSEGWANDHGVLGSNPPGTFSLNVHVQVEYVFVDPAKNSSVREESLPCAITDKLVVENELLKAGIFVEDYHHVGLPNI